MALTVAAQNRFDGDIYLALKAYREGKITQDEYRERFYEVLANYES